MSKLEQIIQGVGLGLGWGAMVTGIYLIVIVAACLLAE